MPIFRPDFSLPDPPKVRAVPHTLTAHQHTRIDDYYWLRDRDNPEVLAYLRAENDYAQKVLAHTDPLQAKLFEEIKGRIKEDDLSVPFKMRDYWYFIRFREGGEYPLYCRKTGERETKEELMVDANELAKGHDYFSLGSWAVSSGQDVLAFATDTQCPRIYTIQFKDFQQGTLLPDVIESVA